MDSELCNLRTHPCAHGSDKRLGRALAERRSRQYQPCRPECSWYLCYISSNVWNPEREHNCGVAVTDIPLGALKVRGFFQRIFALIIDWSILSFSAFGTRAVAGQR
jgi:hypothetical protein